MGLSLKLLHNRKRTIKFPLDKASIVIRCTIDRKSFFINTDVRIIQNHWDSKKYIISSSCPDWMKLNKIIQNKINKINSYYNDCLLDNKIPQREEIKLLFIEEEVIEVKSNYSDFIKYMEEEIKNRTDIEESTRKTHLSRIKKLKDFSGGKLLFENIDFNFVEEFENYLKKVKKNSPNTIWSSHKDLKTYIKRAIKKGYMGKESNPYTDYVIRKEETNREALESSELLLMENYKPISVAEEVILDKFLFSCYTGMRISDQNLVREKNFNFTSKNECYLTFKMKKVKTTVRNMPIHKLFLGKAMPIVYKYLEQENETGLFPLRSDKYTNRVLKEIAKKLKIKKKVTTHIGRHTFGSILAEKTSDPILIKTLMGHKKIETSMIYITMSKARVESKVDRIVW